ncbi:MAG: ribonuclease P protein subunit [Desulfurococcales archaeon]|nr:ribonuclease P protein subunit [Desulfurococcales archaeon]
MRITRSNIVYHELVGLEVEVARHENKELESVKGLVAWETKKTLVVKDHSSKREKRILKAGGIFTFKLPDGGNVTLKGEEIIGAPWDRAKRIIRGR